MAAYPVMESFYTLQGEGFYTGQAAYFVRLGGCDVGCVWCDVKESWDASKHPLTNTETIVNGALQYPGRLVVITGGEPAMYDLDELTSAFKSAGFRTHIETSGAYPVTGHFDWICVSPKKFKFPLESELSKADELKVVVFNKSDFAWAEQHAEHVKTGCKLYLQPEWEKASVMTPLILEYIMTHPQWQLSLQTHKYLNIP